VKRTIVAVERILLLTNNRNDPWCLLFYQDACTTRSKAKQKPPEACDSPMRSGNARSQRGANIEWGQAEQHSGLPLQTLYAVFRLNLNRKNFSTALLRLVVELSLRPAAKWRFRFLHGGGKAIDNFFPNGTVLWLFLRPLSCIDFSHALSLSLSLSLSFSFSHPLAVCGCLLRWLRWLRWLLFAAVVF